MARRNMILGLAGAAAALAVLTIPVGLLEMVVASTGLSEAFPAAAPPLGWKARLIVAAFAGLMAVAAIAAIGRNHDEKSGRGAAKGDRKMGFAFSRLTALARGRRTAGPVLRRADAHPDAPAREPIFASRDFEGLDIFRRARAEGQAQPHPMEMPHAPLPCSREELGAPAQIADFAPQPAFRSPAPVVAQEPVAPTPGFGTPVDVRDSDAVAPEPAAFDAALPAASAEPEPAGPPPFAMPEGEASAPPAQPLEGLSVAQLTERLERGLAHRHASVAGRAPVLADLPPAAPVPVREDVEPEVDAALAAALGALRGLAARAG
ncbi:hypothetical protein GGR44_003051 [Sphingobium fontiphilum]|uniref:Uncharacterized protein n=1 Tax=Sphingobium fontiphilum TaxID=944425 RepID=A0A7W6DHY2_9SPHN|nr:hypothetical protein [Sphingobium fontiphilum]MBB3983363.1 hypothetical protein [Sphingobium fontiphilum]